MGLPRQFEPDKMRSELYEGIEYKDFWAGSSKNSLDELEHSLVTNLLPDSGFRIIDIGCGFGRLANCYLDRFEQVVLLDGATTLLKQAQESYKDRAVYIAADANRLPFMNHSFDSAIMFRVFHHLPDSQKTLLELKRILGSSGSFIFNYSNKLSARQLMKRLLRAGKENALNLEPIRAGKTMILHHPKYVHQLLNQVGFSQTEYFGAGIVDKLSGKLGPFEKLLPSGEALAPIFGTIKLAPWMVCKTQAQGGEALKDGDIEDVLACPECYGSLNKSPQKYECTECGRSYPIVDGISDFRLDV